MKKVLYFFLLLSGLFFTSPVIADETEKAAIKEMVIQGILKDFQDVYYTFDENHGKTHTIVIKDFDLLDEETYGIIDEDTRLGPGRFWVIDLPKDMANMKKYELRGSICCKGFARDSVREDLVTATRSKGLSFQFTVPMRAEDLPMDNP